MFFFPSRGFLELLLLALLAAGVVTAQALRPSYTYEYKTQPKMPEATQFLETSGLSGLDFILRYKDSRYRTKNLLISPSLVSGIPTAYDLDLPPEEKRRLGVSDTSDSIAFYDRNQQGQFVGTLKLSSSRSTGFLWDGKSVQLIEAPVPGSEGTVDPRAINRSGLIVGKTGPFAWMMNPGDLPSTFNMGPDTIPTSVNDLGHIVGHFRRGIHPIEGSMKSGFVRGPNGPSVIQPDRIYLHGREQQDLKALSVMPLDINNNGEVVGVFLSNEVCPATGAANRSGIPSNMGAAISMFFEPTPWCIRSFYYHRGEFHMIAPYGRALQPAVYVTGINDQGVIVGFEDSIAPESGKRGYFFYGIPGGLSVSDIFSKPYRSVVDRDFNGDGKPDLLWQHPSSGEVWIWFLDGARFSDHTKISDPTIWKVVGAADFNGDGKADLLWQHPSSGEVWTWFLDGARFSDHAKISDPTAWKVVGTADFNGNGKADLLWQHPSSGEVWTWFLDGTKFRDHTKISDPTSWKVVGTADFDRDGKPDLIWQHPSSGEVWTWFLDGARFSNHARISEPTIWKVIGASDFNADGKPDLLWQHPSSGEAWTWFLDGTKFSDHSKISDPTVWHLR